MPNIWIFRARDNFSGTLVDKKDLSRHIRIGYHKLSEERNMFLAWPLSSHSTHADRIVDDFMLR